MNPALRIETIRRLHETFVGLTKKNIILVSSDPPGRTDTLSFIAIPIEDPEAGLIHKHEWSHITGKTNLHARDKFVEEFVRSLSRRDPALSNSAEWLNHLCNALDDLRVNSLWRLVYPASASDIAQRWSRIILSARGDNILHYLIATGLGIDSIDSKWRRYRDLFAEAASRVRGRGYTHVLLTTRWLVETALSPLLAIPEEEGEPLVPSAGSSARALSRPKKTTADAARATRLLGALSLASRRTAHLQDLPTPTVADPEPGRTKRVVSAALGRSSSTEVDQLVEEDIQEIQSMRNVMDTNLPRESETKLLTKKVPHSLVHTLRSEDVHHQPLQDADVFGVARMRSRFMKVMNARKRRRSDSGGTLDVQGYVDLMLGSGDLDIFEDEKRAKGFTALLLIDMSGSMTRLWDGVSRACKMISMALDFPLSIFEVWGFSGTGEATTMFHFEDTKKGYAPVSNSIGAWGTTPLHNALPIAINRLEQLPGTTKHLFIVTDGDPMHMGPFSRQQLHQLVRESVVDARRHNVKVVTLIVGGKAPGPVLDRMFGSGRWERVLDGQGDLGLEMRRLVEMAFLDYLRR